MQTDYDPNAGNAPRLSFTKATLVRLIDALNPNPEDPEEPHGPGGPVSRGWRLNPSLATRLTQQTPIAGPHPDPWRRGVGRARLQSQVSPVAGPQPDPWREPFDPFPGLWRPERFGPGPQPWGPEVFGPTPEPWRHMIATRIARSVIDYAVGKYMEAERLAEVERVGQTAEGVRAHIFQFVDDYCGTVPRKWPRPWPWPLTRAEFKPDPVELLVAGAQFHKASEVVDGQLASDFATAADRLFEAGLRGLEGTQAEQPETTG